MKDFASVDRAITEVASGRPVIVVDDTDGRDEGVLVFAAEKATPELVAFMVRHTSGYVSVSLPAVDCERLGLPPTYHADQDRQGTADTVTVDAREGVRSGLSAADRARTVRLLADPTARPDDFTRPGHVLALSAQLGGLLRRAGHTEAAGDLCRLAGLAPVGVLSEIVSSAGEGDLSEGGEPARLAADHDLVTVTIAELIAYRRRIEPQVERVADARIPTPYGVFTAVGFDSKLDGIEHIALVCGDLGDGEDVLVRLHSECLTGDIFASLRCDCGPQLHAAMAAVAQEGRGVVLYMRGHEGRGIGIIPKLQAYRLQDGGADTVDANLDLGLPVDARDYGSGAQILFALGVKSMRLLTNNPAKTVGLEGYGLRVNARVPLPVAPNPENLRYLRTKRDRMGHYLVELDPTPGSEEAGGGDGAAGSG